MANEQIVLDIVTKTNEAIASMETFANKSVKSLGRVEKSVGLANLSIASFLGNIAANFTGKIFDEVTQAATEMFNVFIVDGVKAAQESEDGINQLNFALKAAGNYTEQTSNSLQDFARQLQNTSKYSDDAIIKNTAYLQSLTDLDEKGLKNAIQATVDLAAVTGKDLDSATQLVAKAAEGETGAFKKLGIEIRKGSTDAETFANTLKALERFQGAAAAQAGTFSGRMAILKNNFNDLQEATGKTITENTAFVSIMKTVNDFILKLTGLVSDNKEQIARIFTDLVILAAKLSGELIKISSAVFGLLDGVKLYAVGLELLWKKPLEGIKALSGSYADTTESIEKFKERNGSVAETFIQLERNVAEGNTTIDKFKDLVDNTTASLENISNKPLKMIGPSVKDLLNNYSKQAQLEKYNTESKLVIQLEYLDKLALNSQNNAARLVEIEKEKNRLIYEDQQYYKGLALSDKEAKQLEQTTQMQKELEEYLKFNLDKNNIDQQNQSAKLMAEQVFLDELLRKRTLNKDQQEVVDKKILANDKALTRLRLQQGSEFFGNMASLMQTGNETLFAIGKASALASAIIQGYLAVQNALAITPPWVGIALAASMAVKTAVQIAGIAATNLASGITSVPPGFANDTFRANLTSGERVVNVQQNRDLTTFLDEQRKLKSNNNNDTVLNTIRDVLVDMLNENRSKESTTVVNIGNREIIKEVRAGLRAGYSLEVG